MAEVYLARTGSIEGFEKRLALKMIHPKFSEDSRFIEMFIEEAKIAVQLNHANIGQIFDLGRIGQTYYIAMEFIDGADIHRILKRSRDVGRPLPIESICWVGACLAAGLDYAHHRQDAQGHPLEIVHRDVSPQNVLVSFTGDVKIVDFGIAKAAVRARETEAGVIKGKFSYMSPEQARGEAIDHRSDIYSAGILLHEMLCGQTVFAGDNVADLLEKVRRAKVTPPSLLRPETPPALERTILQALAKRPRDRHGSALEMHRELSRLLATIAPGYTGQRMGAFVRELFAEEARASASAKALERHEYPVEESQSVIFDLADPNFVQSVMSAAPEVGRVGPTVAISTPPGVDSTILATPGSSGETGDEWDARTVFDPAMAEKVLSDVAWTLTPAPIGQEGDTEPIAPVRPPPVPQRPRPAHAATAPTTPAVPRPVRPQAPAKGVVPPRPPPRPASSPPPVPPRPPPSPTVAAPAPTPLPAAPVPPTRGSTPPRGARPSGPVRPAPILGGLTREVKALRRVSLPRLPTWGWIVLGLSLCAIVGGVIFALQPPPPPPPSLLIVTTPPNADVRVAGVPQAHPVRIEGLPAGTRLRAEAYLPGYEPWIEDLELQPGPVQYNVVLRPLRGTLYVETAPPGADVFVGGVRVGVSPMRVADLEARGEIVVDLRLAGYVPRSVIHRWDGTRTGRVSEALQPEPQRR